MSDSRPTLYVTNWSSRKLHGPGRKFTIMARPRRWEHGQGLIGALVPLGCEEEMDAALAERRHGASGGAMFRYRRAYEQRLTLLAQIDRLSPGKLHVTGTDHAVQDGDTACCACSRAEAAAGRCHRRWAVPFLRRAGWRVVLDGEEVTA